MKKLNLSWENSERNSHFFCYIYKITSPADEFGNIFAKSFGKPDEGLLNNETKKYYNMSNKKHNHQHEEPEMKIHEQPADAPEIDDVAVEDEEESGELETLKNALVESQNQLENQKKEYLFLMAEFDNFRKRNVRERADLLKNAAESVLKGILPIVDDFERGLDAIKESSDAESVKEGMQLIYNKLVKYLEQNGVKEIPTADAQFDTEYHEAVALVPVDDEDKKGKIIDTVEKGYTLNDKVLRHAKVAVGQ